MTTPNQDLGSIEDFFSAGGGAPLKFTQVGQVYSGTITHLKVTQQTKFPSGDPDFNKDGSPKKQIVATLRTNLRDPNEADDEGLRNLYIKGNLQFAVSQALKPHGLKAPQVGGILVVKFSSERDTGKGNPLKEFEAAYKPAEPAGLEAAFANTNAAAQQAPPVQQQYQAPTQQVQPPVQQAPVQQVQPPQQQGLSASEQELLAQLNSATQ